MIVTIVCDVLGAENNGTTIATMNLIRSLKAKGHTVKVLCPDEDKKNLDGFYVVPKLNVGPLNSYVKKNGVTIAKNDEEIVRKSIEGADIVHIAVPFSLAHTAVKICKANNIPMTASFHCQAENITNHLFMMNIGPVNRFTYKILNNLVFKHVDAIHYPTQFICNVFESTVGPTNHYVISNGVNKAFVKKEVEKPSELKDKFVILFTGRYSHEKSHKVLIRAVGKSKYNDKIQLIFAGDGPLKEKIAKYSKKKLKNQPIMHFYSRKELIDVINYSDLYVHPAEIEIEAIACLEAISCGLVPVIANSKRSATRFFALSDANLFKNKNAYDLSKKINYWIENPEEKAKCSENYVGYAERFDYDVCMDKMEKMMFDVIEAFNAK